MENWLIPLVAIICAVGLPVLLLMILVVRVTRTKHEERMAMIEKGIVLEEPERKTNKFNALRNGLLMIGLALGAMAGIFFGDSISSYDWEGFSVVIFTVLGGGIAYLVYFFIVMKMMEKEKEE